MLQSHKVDHGFPGALWKCVFAFFDRVNGHYYCGSIEDTVSLVERILVRRRN